jgi:hypothetical protein
MSCLRAGLMVRSSSRCALAVAATALLMLGSGADAAAQEAVASLTSRALPDAATAAVEPVLTELYDFGDLGAPDCFAEPGPAYQQALDAAVRDSRLSALQTNGSTLSFSATLGQD